MSIRILLVVLIAATFVGCNTAFKSQTPDDVYYSPVRVIEEDTKEETETREVSDGEERRIRMAHRDRRWRDYDYDYDYRYHPYRYGYGYGYYYNPYYYPYPVYHPGVTFVNPKNHTVRSAPLGSYTTPVAVKNPKTGETEYINRQRAYNNSNTRGYQRARITPDSQSEPRTRSNDTRTYSPSNNNSNNNSGGRPVTRPPRN